MLNETQEKALMYVFDRGTVFFPEDTLFFDNASGRYSVNKYDAFRLYKVDLNTGWLGINVFHFDKNNKYQYQEPHPINVDDFFNLLRFSRIQGRL